LYKPTALTVCNGSRLIIGDLIAAVHSTAWFHSMFLKM
jgi:hypothetical protein